MLLTPSGGVTASFQLHVLTIELAAKECRRRRGGGPDYKHELMRRAVVWMKFSAVNSSVKAKLGCKVLAALVLMRHQILCTPKATYSPKCSPAYNLDLSVRFQLHCTSNTPFLIHPVFTMAMYTALLLHCSPHRKEDCSIRTDLQTNKNQNSFNHIKA